MYALIKKILFQFDPETSHVFALRALAILHRLGIFHLLSSVPDQPRTVMGITFPNPIGLAAGLDKNADYVDVLAQLGFGFIEIGTVTPKPQIGNPRPRLFRLSDQQAIINRMGFNNKGVDHVVQQLKKTHYRGVLGINIGKNKDTPLEQAAEDYRYCFRQLWPFASYITINISSPNTAGLRTLQQGNALSDLLSILKHEQQMVVHQHKRYVPLVVKLSPDLSSDEVDTIAQVLLQQRIDGVIATNTTLQRKGIETSPFANEAGGLSGKPLQMLSTQIIQQLHAVLKDRIPIIGVGGIMDKSSAEEKIKAGASLLQIYTGFIYHGPALIRELASLFK